MSFLGFPRDFSHLHLTKKNRGDWTRTSDLVVPNHTRYQLRHAPTVERCYHISFAASRSILESILEIVGSSELSAKSIRECYNDGSMNALLPPPKSGEKLKAIFALGIGSNFFTLTGGAISMIVLGKTGWVDSFFDQVWFSFCLAPTFMGDAVNSYVLGRIRLEKMKGWDDVQILPEGRESLLRLHRFWRTLSFISATLLGLILLTSLSPDPSAGRALCPLFLVVFTAHAARCMLTIQTCFAPVVPMFGGSWVIRRAAVTGAIFGGWLLWLWTRTPGPLSGLGFLLHGTVYFLMCAFLQPLPSKFSVIQPQTNSVHDMCASPLENGLENPAERVAVANVSAWWKADGGFTSVGFFHMPLIELPLFQSYGEALRSPDGKILALILLTEVKPRIHRTLVSMVDDGAYITTDFGAPDAHFPEGFHYQTIASTETDPAFLNKHAERVPANLDPIDSPPWDALTALSIMMLQFLSKKLPKASNAGADRNLDLNPDPAPAPAPAPSPASALSAAGSASENRGKGGGCPE